MSIFILAINVRNTCQLTTLLQRNLLTAVIFCKILLSSNKKYFELATSVGSLKIVYFTFYFITEVTGTNSLIISLNSKYFFIVWEGKAC